MKSVKTSLLEEINNLRRRAEDQLLTRSPGGDCIPELNDMKRLCQELQIHQIELELQNNELCQERNLAETALDRYTDLFEFAPIGYFTLDRDGKIREVNLSGAGMIGIERSRLVGRRFGQLVAAGYRPLFSSFIGKVFASQCKELCELEIRRDDSSPMVVRIEALAFDSNQECRAAVVDITTLKTAEEALRKSEKLYRAIGETIDFGVWVCDPDGRNVYASDSFLQMVGMTQEQCSNFGWGDVLHPDDMVKTISAWQECVQTGGVWDIEHRFRGSDGQWHPVLARGVAVRDDAGKILYWAGLNLDISRQKLAQDALREKEELNNKTLQALPAHIVVIDRTGRIIAANQAWMEFARENDATKLEEVAEGSNYCDVCRRSALGNDEDAAQALAGIETVMRGASGQFTMEYSCHSPQEQRWFLMTVVPLNSGGEGGAVITHLNISDRKKAEENLLNVLDNLESRVRERTGELREAVEQLTRENVERTNAETALKRAYAEINTLKDRLQEENIYLQQEIAREYNFGEIIGQSSAMSYVFFRVEQVAAINATVLLLGETGSGKGVIARAIHSRSARKDRPMITVNCTALPANLIESELFGREKGAFTGASARQMGRFELADGGTIFLDEIGEMPLELQCKLLRVIQDGEFERLGSPRTIKVDVRIIAASNRNLEAEIRNGTFREDLYYRLNVFPITIPPLRQRKEDIPLLVNYIVAKFNKKIGKKILTVSKDTMKKLEEYHWPGNVRELESVIERAVIISQGSTLDVLDRFVTQHTEEDAPGEEVKAIADLEYDHIMQVLKKTGWRIEGKNGAAILLGLNSSTLRARMRKFGIVRQ